jgi:hypothetical protein
MVVSYASDSIKKKQRQSERWTRTEPSQGGESSRLFDGVARDEPFAAIEDEGLEPGVHLEHDRDPQVVRDVRGRQVQVPQGRERGRKGKAGRGGGGGHLGQRRQEVATWEPEGEMRELGADR